MSEIMLPGYPSKPGQDGPPGFPGWPGFPGRRPRPREFDNRGKVKEIYQNVLKREADQEGLDYWTNQLDTGNQTFDQVVKNIRGSDEGRNAFLKNTYENYLGREADEEGLAYWDNELKSGKSRQQIEESIFNSEEGQKYYQKNYAPKMKPKRPRGEGRPPKGRPIGDDQIDPDKGGWLDFYNDQTQKKINSGGGFNKEIADRDFEWSNPGQGSLTVMRDYVNPTTGEKTWVTAGKSPKAGTGWQLVDQNADLGIARGSQQKASAKKTANSTQKLTTSYTPTKYAPADMSRFAPANTASADTSKGKSKKSSDFGTYSPGTAGGNLFNQGWGNMVSWGNKFKDNKAIQGFISGSKLDSSQTMMNMGLDLLYQKGQMSQRAEYIGGLENLKTGNTMKLMAAEGGILKDLQGQQGDIESRQIGERGDQERRGLRVAGQENRAGIQTQGLQDRMLTRETGDQERKTQRDKYREDRKMRADARGAIRRSGSRFFG